MRVISEGANKCKKEKFSVCMVCTMRGLRFDAANSRYSNVTRTVRETD